MSLRNKYVLGLGLILFLVFGLMTAKNLRSEEKRIYTDNVTRLTLMTNVIKNALTALMLEGKAADFQGFIETLMADDINAVRLFREDGTVISSSTPSEKGQRLGKNMKGIAQPAMTSFENGGHLLFAMRVPIFNERPCQRCHGAEKSTMGVLDIELLMDNYNKSIKDSRENAALLFVVSITALFVSLSLITSSLVIKPLRGIMGTVKKVEEGDLRARFDTERFDEIGDLARSLNSMLSELNRARQEVENCHIESMRKVEKMATLGELASAIAHEIKNPLAGISGAIQVFAEDFPEADPRRGIINEVLSEIERLDKAVRDLLNFAKPPEPHRIRTSVVPVIERALRLIGPQAKKQGVEINIVAVTEPPVILLDPEQMQQVFLNIMLNALHSMPGGGTVTVSIHDRPEEEKLDVNFSDIGHGISQADIKNIFKPFFTTKHMGTGLGLAISKNIVEKHGGDLSVESQVGVGSSFKATLPYGSEDHA